MQPTHDRLREALAAAGSAHHDYETHALHGEYDKLWPGFYAAYALGRLGDFATASTLSRLLSEAPSDGNWASSAANYVLDELPTN